MQAIQSLILHSTVQFEGCFGKNESGGQQNALNLKQISAQCKDFAKIAYYCHDTCTFSSSTGTALDGSPDQSWPLG